MQKNAAAIASVIRKGQSEPVVKPDLRAKIKALHAEINKLPITRIGIADMGIADLRFLQARGTACEPKPDEVLQPTENHAIWKKKPPNTDQTIHQAKSPKTISRRIRPIMSTGTHSHHTGTVGQSKDRTA